MPPSHIDTLLDLYGAEGKECQDQCIRAAVGKLLWLALIRSDISYATKELSRDVTAPTEQSLAKLKHLLPYLNGTRHAVLSLRPHSPNANGQFALDLHVPGDVDWAGCNRTRKRTTGSTVSVLDFCVMATSRTHSTLALSSGKLSCMRLVKVVQKDCSCVHRSLKPEWPGMPRFKGETDWLIGCMSFCECFATANVVMSEYA